MYMKGRHEAHVLIVFRRRKPFTKKEEHRIYGILEKALKEELNANVQKIEVIIP